MPRPLKPPARGLLSQTSSEHHAELYLKPDSTSESGYIDWIHAILFLRFCSVKRLCASAQHPAVAHLIRVHSRASAALLLSVLAGAALSSILAATPRRQTIKRLSGRASPLGRWFVPIRRAQYSPSRSMGHLAVASFLVTSISPGAMTRNRSSIDNQACC